MAILNPFTWMDGTLWPRSLLVLTVLAAWGGLRLGSHAEASASQVVIELLDGLAPGGLCGPPLSGSVRPGRSYAMSM